MVVVSIERAAWNEALHPRDAGKFTAKAGTEKNKENVSFDGKRGTGYGAKGGDSRVHKLQQALNKLGLTDAAGKSLELDGKLGPKTTAAIKKAQRKLGLKADGVVTPALLGLLEKAAAGIKSDTPAAPVKKAVKKAATSVKKAAKKKVPVKTAVDNDRNRRNAQKVGGI